MPLDHGYGVLLGTVGRYARDTPDNQGKYFHGMLYVDAPLGRYTCAIDVDSHQNSISVERRIHHLRIAEWSDLLSLPDGFHSLASGPVSGAVDYIRDNRLKNFFLIPEWRQELPAIPRIPAWVRLRELLDPVLRLGLPSKSPRIRFSPTGGRIVTVPAAWKSGSGEEALVDLEAVMNGAVRVAVFGEPFTTGLGVHNIHQNQGDPIGSDWASENGIWQDGMTLFVRADGSAAAFLNKFSSQAFETDNQGRPS